MSGVGTQRLPLGEVPVVVAHCQATWREFPQGTATLTGAVYEPTRLDISVSSTRCRATATESPPKPGPKHQGQDQDK